MLKKNQLHTARISGYTAQGLGVCRIDGQVVFVHKALDGELAEIRILKVLKNEAYGKIERLIEPSPHRIAPDCPEYKWCGGCATRHMDYTEELRFKATRVTEALNRIGGQSLESVPILGAENTEKYRNKAIFAVAPPKIHNDPEFCYEEHLPQVGFYRARSHDVVTVEECRIQSAAADIAAKTVARWMRDYDIEPYDEETLKGLVRHIYVRVAEVTGEVLVCLVVNGAKLPHEKELVAALQEQVSGLKTVVLCQNTRPGNAVLSDDFRILWGDGVVEDVLCGLRFRLSPRSFYQVNRRQAERLYDLAIEKAEISKEDTVLDLYCGTGTITLCLARACKEAIGVEIVEAAILDARKNAAENAVENVLFFCADAAEAAKELAKEGLRPDVVVVDPPRKGLSLDVIRVMAQDFAPRRIVYVSCDPGTLARDVKLLEEQGYKLKSATAVDLFPRTHHVETVVMLEKE